MSEHPVIGKELAQYSDGTAFRLDKFEYSILKTIAKRYGYDEEYLQKWILTRSGFGLGPIDQLIGIIWEIKLCMDSARADLLVRDYGDTASDI